jgi:catechol 2,3-dioxygenase-like lactoylglutathione lyase family enzyme
MEKSSTFIQITPFLDVPSLEDALTFFRDVLGFEVRLRNGDYAYVQRERAGIRLIENPAAVPGNGRFAHYVDVTDVDALHAELKAMLETLPAGHVEGPLDQPYGQRELMIVAPDGNRIVFGQFIGERTQQSTPLEMKRRDLRASRFTDVALANSVFDNVNLADASFENVRLSGADFSRVTLAGSTFKDTDLSNVEISHSRLAGLRIEGILVTDLIEVYRRSRAS